MSPMIGSGPMHEAILRAALAGGYRVMAREMPEVGPALTRIAERHREKATTALSAALAGRRE